MLRALGIGLVVAMLALPATALAETQPGLVMLVAIDQLRRDRLEATLPGGLGRLAREGRVYSDAWVDHAMTETCPGHVVMATGRTPAHSGIPGNYFLHPKTQERVYCVEDETTQGRLLARAGDEEQEPKDGRSPRNMRVDAIGDWLKAARPGSRVFSVSGKDRAAIALGGKQPDGVFWYVKQPPVAFTTSRYYASDLPPWLTEWNGSRPLEDGILSKLPLRWHHEPAAAAGSPRPDDYGGESTEFGRSSGHPLGEGAEEDVGAQVYASPYLDDLTLELASRLIVREKLGQRGETDLLAVSLSATDIVGHLYGPRSHEARDALLRLDAGLGRLIGLAEEKVGKGRVLVALSADHGVLELPEWLVEEDRRECAESDLRVGLVRLLVGLSWNLHNEIGGFFSIPRQWVDFAGTQIAVRRELAESQGVEVDDVIRATRQYLESHAAVSRVWTREEILSGATPTAALYRNSFDLERSGDLAIEIGPTCLIHYQGTGTSHGTPHAYDRAVPLVFMGPGVTPGVVADPAASIDLAPTLAALLGIAPPDDVDGRVLFGGGDAK